MTSFVMRTLTAELKKVKARKTPSLVFFTTMPVEAGAATEAVVQAEAA